MLHRTIPMRLHPIIWSILPPVHINEKEDIKEEFLTFVPIINMHGQGYDGGSNRPLNLGNAVVVCYDVMCDDVILNYVITIDCARSRESATILAQCFAICICCGLIGKNAFLPLALACLGVQILRGTCKRIPSIVRTKRAEAVNTRCGLHA